MRRHSFFILRLSVFIFFFSFAGTGRLFAADLSSNEENALSYLRQLFFETSRLEICGISPMPEAISLSKTLKFSLPLMSGKKVLSSIKDTVYRCEYFFPEKRGIIDSTFSRDSLYSVSDSVVGNSPSFDWIDLLLKTLAAPDSPPKNDEIFDINDGRKILEMLEGSDDRGIDSADEKKGDEELPKEYTYTKNDGSLRRFAYDGEQFSVWTEGDNTILVNSYGDKIVRKYFDSLFRLSKTERFKGASLAKKMSLENEIKYEYSPDSASPEKSVEEQFSEKKRFENHYDQSGRLLSSLESHYEDREIKQKGKKKQDAVEKETLLLNDKKTSRIFDSEGRIIEEETITWNYKKLLSGRYSTSQTSRKNIYDYSAVTPENKIPPNLKFYEDGELHLERKYTSSDTYSEKLYFDGGFSVELLYDGGVKKTEIIYLDGSEKRRRDFDY